MFSELTPFHWQQIELQLLQFFKSQQGHCGKVLNTTGVWGNTVELDSFQDTSLTELMNVFLGENDHLIHSTPSKDDHLQDLLASVFHY